MRVSGFGSGLLRAGTESAGAREAGVAACILLKSGERVERIAAVCEQTQGDIPFRAVTFVIAQEDRVFP